MELEKIFEKFEKGGRLVLHDKEIMFGDIPWTKHAAFEGVELKHIVTSEYTEGKFSFHLVRIAPGKKIGVHIHEGQTETHEVIAGAGVCVNNGAELLYEPGVVSVFPAGVPHEVRAGAQGLYIFAKFIPPLC